jgi:DNA-binding transcriptional LysR family regulator
MEDRLRKFASLVELGSFTKAAETLHISQPALSASIKKLERELKEQLLVRGSQPLKLTPAGEHAYATAKEINVSTSNLSAKLEQLRQRKPSVAIGMIDSIIAQALFSHGTAFGELEQNTHLSLIVDNSRNLSSAVLRGELDIAFVVEPAIRSVEESLRYTRVGAEPLMAVCSPTHYQTAQTAIALGKLSPFISYDQASNTSRLIAQACNRAGLRLRPTFYSTSPPVMLQLVTANRGTAVLPYLLVQDAIASGELRPLRLTASYVIERPIVCITQRGRELSPLLASAISEVRQTLSQLHAAALQIDK